MEIGDRVIVRNGAWAWMKAHGWKTQSGEEFGIDGSSGVVLDDYVHGDTDYALIDSDSVVFPIKVPREYLTVTVSNYEG